MLIAMVTIPTKEGLGRVRGVTGLGCCRKRPLGELREVNGRLVKRKKEHFGQRVECV